jgi:hypothetical protein
MNDETATYAAEEIETALTLNFLELRVDTKIVIKVSNEEDIKKIKEKWDNLPVKN